MAALKYWVWLASRPGLSTLVQNRLLEWFGTPEQVYFAQHQAYGALPVLKGNDITALLDKNLVAAKQIIDSCEANSYRLITLSDGEYPGRLRNIPDPPLVLYVRGRLPFIDEEAAVGVVGTRSCTPYGVKSAEKMGYELSRYGCLVVTGLAKGIDTVAALGALRAGGRVVGVVGAGLDIVYPPENKQLFEDVAMLGAIVSEYPPGTPATGEHFPRRNRLISGLSLGVAVIEAPLKSGALITASCALEQGRDVFALPGNVDAPASAGTNSLIREGAILVTSGRDIAEEYVALFPEKIRDDRKKIPLDPAQEEKLLKNMSAKNRPDSGKKEIDNDKTVEYIDLVKLKESLSADEFLVLSCIGPNTVHIDEIIERSKLSAGAVLSVLTLLELSSYIEQEKGKYFKLRYETTQGS